MSSIAYVTDGNMMQFHRLNGNTAINFWRPSNAKKFTDFSEGDYLFFLTKGTEKGKKKEKGIVGYGKLKKQRSLSIKKMWKEYGPLNGYSTEKELNEAILKVTKSGSVPAQLSCLYLEDVVLFGEPVYLSNLGITISNKVESYIYLDKEDPQATNKILQAAEANGIDLWASVFSKEKQSNKVFSEDTLRHQLSVCAKKLGKGYYSTSEVNKAKKLLKKEIEDHGFEAIKGSETDGFKVDGDQVIVALPLVYSSKDWATASQTLLGRMIGYLVNFQKENKDYTLKIQILSDHDLPQDFKNALHYVNGERHE